MRPLLRLEDKQKSTQSGYIIHCALPKAEIKRWLSNTRLKSGQVKKIDIQTLNAALASVKPILNCMRIEFY